MNLAKLAELTDAEIECGAADLEITGAAGLDLAASSDVTFLANPKYTPQIKTTKAAAIFLNENEKIERSDIAVLRSKNPYLSYTKALRLFHPEQKRAAEIHQTAVVHQTAKIGANVFIGANAVVGANTVVGDNAQILPNVCIYENVRIGANTILHSGAAVRENCEIGANCIIHNNATIGSDGFGFAKDERQRWLKIPQIGKVVIEDDVEIGANTTIDRASVGETRIKRGAKIDNLVQVGHSCFVGEDALICSQTGLAGSSTIGKRVVLAGQVGIAGHLTVGDDAVITAKSATSHDTPAGKIVSGIPAFDNKEWLRSIAAFRRLGEMARVVRDLVKRVDALDKARKPAAK
jgi:UDP-3-O-[3-hydroxymyristoyl] glucosamine N-acyltransferase